MLCLLTIGDFMRRRRSRTNVHFIVAHFWLLGRRLRLRYRILPFDGAIQTILVAIARSTPSIGHGNKMEEKRTNEKRSETLFQKNSFSINGSMGADQLSTSTNGWTHCFKFSICLMDQKLPHCIFIGRSRQLTFGQFANWWHTDQKYQKFTVQFQENLLARKYFIL